MVYSIKILLGDGSINNAEIELEYGSTDAAIAFRYIDINISLKDYGPFYLLQKIRSQLELQSITILCNCSRFDVHPSRMTSWGTRAYILEMGKPGTELIDIMDPIIEMDKIGTVEKQEAYYEIWIADFMK